MVFIYIFSIYFAGEAMGYLAKTLGWNIPSAADRFLLKNVFSEMCECKKVRATSCVLGLADKKS